MSKELIVHSSQHETRLAILEDDHLVELHIESESQHALAGSIYKGRVTRVLPGMQSAFVNIGLDRDAFLYVSDFFDESDEEFDQVPVAAVAGGAEESEEPSASVAPAANGAAAQEDGSVPEKPVEAEEVRPGGRDRRGRRSRRRRGRGSSFPATKYADVGAEGESGEEESKVSAAAEKDASGEASSRDGAAETEFVVLPGESLAKYSAASAEPFSDAAAETDGPDSRSRGREEAVGPESLIDGDVPDSTAFEPRQGTEDHPQIAQDSREDENPDTEPSGPGEPAEQDVVAESVTSTAGEDQVESLEENESLLSSDREEEPQPDEQPAAKAEQESEDTDRAEEAAGEPAVAEAAAATLEAGAEPDEAAPEEVAPEPRIAEASLREEPAEATPAAAPHEPEKLPEPTEPDDEHHAFPGYPGPPMADPDENGGSGEGVASGSINGSETGQTASDGSEDSEPRDGETEGDASDASDSREARVRGRSESSSYVHRRGRRGRRRSRRQRNKLREKLPMMLRRHLNQAQATEAKAARLPTCSRRVRKCSSRSRRNPSAEKAPASRRILRCRAAFWFTCRRWITSAYRGKYPLTKSAFACGRSYRHTVPACLAVSSCEQPVRESRKKIFAATCCSFTTSGSTFATGPKPLPRRPCCTMTTMSSSGSCGTGWGTTSNHLGRRGSGIRANPAVCRTLPARSAQERQTLHPRQADVRSVQHHE